MKQSGTTIFFVLVCVGLLVAAFVIGICIREIRFGGAGNESKTTIAPEKTRSELERNRAQTSGDLSPEERIALVEQRAGMRERFENMSEEEREKFRAQMRDRFGGRRQDMGHQLSEEDRAKFREEMQELTARAGEMSEEEMEQARAKIFEKYGIPSRGSGGRTGGGGEGGRR